MFILFCFAFCISQKKNHEKKENKRNQKKQTTLKVAEAMEKDSKTKLNVLKVDGGMTASDVTLQMQSDLLQIPVGMHSFVFFAYIMCCFCNALYIL